jgi:hypothetical protein
MHHVRKPSAASESFITALAILFFIVLALLFQFLDRRKKEHANVEKIEQKSAGEPRQVLAANDINSLPPFTKMSSDKISGNINSIEFTTLNYPAHVRPTDSVRSPLPLLDIPKQEITVNAGEGQVYTSSHQSVITIPSNAFLDKEGNIVNGKVDVSYREFYNHVDFFLSGIPMNYDSGNGSQLESAGMFELTASKDNEPVFVNPQKRINVMLTSLNRASGYNLYYFDKQQNKWTYKGESKVTESSLGSRGFVLGNVTKDTFQVKFNYIKPEYFVQLLATGSDELRKSSSSKNPAPNSFTFHFATASNSVPGLNNLSSVSWVYSGDDAKEKYNQVIEEANSGKRGSYHQQTWKDATITEVKNESAYILTLSYNNKTVSMKIKPELTSENAAEKFQYQISHFMLEQDARLEAFNKFSEDTTSYFANNPRYVEDALTLASRAMRQFELDGFGIWNCDRTTQIPQAVTVNATFVDEHDNPLNPVFVYLADKSINSVFTYTQDMLKSFKFNPSGQNLVWAVFPGNIVVVIKPKEFRENYAQSKSSCIFRVVVDTKAVLTRSEIKSQLAFDI